MEHTYAVIMAGGGGDPSLARLQKGKPKQLLPFAGTRRPYFRAR